MKKIVVFISLSIVALALAGCAKQTELSTDTLPVKVTVTGYVRYVALSSTLKKEDPELVGAGHEVNLFYGVPGKEGQVEAYALKTVRVDSDGYFKTTLGCPVGKHLEVRAETSMYGESYATNSAGKNVVSDTYFYAEQKVTLPAGSAHCFALDMVPVANTGIDGLQQPVK